MVDVFIKCLRLASDNDSEQYKYLSVAKTLYVQVYVSDKGYLHKQLAENDVTAAIGSLKTLASNAASKNVKRNIAGCDWTDRAQDKIQTLFAQYKLCGTGDAGSNPNDCDDYEQEDTAASGRLGPYVRGLTLCCMFTVLAIAIFPALYEFLKEEHKMMIAQVCDTDLFKVLYEKDVKELGKNLKNFQKQHEQLIQNVQELKEVLQESSQKMETYKAECNKSMSSVETRVEVVTISIEQLETVVSNLSDQTLLIENKMAEVDRGVQITNESVIKLIHDVETTNKSSMMINASIQTLTSELEFLTILYRDMAKRASHFIFNSRTYIGFLFPDCSDYFVTYVEWSYFLVFVSHLNCNKFIVKIFNFMLSSKQVRILCKLSSFVYHCILLNALVISWQSAYINSVVVQGWQFLCWLPETFGLWGVLCCLVICAFVVNRLV